MNEVATRHEGETAVYQLFVDSLPTKTVQENEQRIAYLNEKKALAQSLGLIAQITMIEQEIRREKSPVLDTPPMTSDEFIIWRAFLPTAYQYYPNGGYGYDGGARGYTYDAIPYPVLAKWKECKDEGVFDHYEIWTPEVKNIDPALVGYVDNHCYMLARWAESDANFITFAGVKRKLVGRWLQANNADVVAVIIVVLALVISFIAGMFIHERDSGFVSFLWAWGSAMIPVFGTGTLVWLLILSLTMRGTPLMRAIIRHTMKKGT